MNRRGVIPIVSILAIAGVVTAQAQTRWVHYNHRKAGNFIITPVNLNAASSAELLRLLEITDVDVQRIIDGRPYRSKSDLLDRKIVSAETYAKIKRRVIGAEDFTMAR